FLNIPLEIRLEVKYSHPSSRLKNSLKMTADVGDSKIVVPFMPSLLHIASVNVAVPLLNDFDLTTLQIAFKKIQQGIPIRDSKDTTFIKCNRAQKKLLFIPEHLRTKVLEAVQGLQYGALQWKSQHSHVLELKDGECIFYWRSDGRVDEIKTVQKLVQNANIDIRKRFHFSCIYCLEESIQTLWTEMERSGETGNLETAHDSMMHFWVKWMSDGSRIPWRQVAAEYFATPARYSESQIARLSSIFPSLRPEDRKKYLYSLQFRDLDDLLLCMYSVTKEEEKQILKWCAVNLLYIYLEWPLRSLFLETEEKLRNYIDELSFQCLLERIFINMKLWEDFDHYELFEGFWNSSHDHFKERAKQIPHIRKIIDSCLNAIKSKRKAQEDEGRHAKKKRLV
ncbi:hypothetical protein AVEN_106925-1, partial [Araneus ventricosus]